MKEEHYRKLEKYYLEAPCNQLLSPIIIVGEGEAEISFDTQPSMFHGAGAVHGSYYFKALDDASYFAANSLVFDVFVLTASFSVDFFRPISKGVLRAQGRIRKLGSTLIFAESVLFDQNGTEIAMGHGSFARSRAPLPE
jgi:uncharacterized protein (TIGR00369 family)